MGGGKEGYGIPKIETSLLGKHWQLLMFRNKAYRTVREMIESQGSLNSLGQGGTVFYNNV